MLSVLRTQAAAVGRRLMATPLEMLGYGLLLISLRLLSQLLLHRMGFQDPRYSLQEEGSDNKVVFGC